MPATWARTSSPGNRLGIEMNQTLIMSKTHPSVIVQPPSALLWLSRTNNVELPQG
jgi:hypothetical protein